MENINELIKQYKKYIRLADYEFGEFQRTHDDDYIWGYNDCIDDIKRMNGM